MEHWLAHNKSCFPQSYKVGAPIPVHVPHSIIMYQWYTFYIQMYSLGT